MTEAEFWQGKRILVTGGAGFLGSHLVKRLVQTRNVEIQQIIIPRSREIDLKKPEDCRKVLEGADIVIHLAARVGGIGFNQENPGSLFYENALMGVNMLEGARQAQVAKFVQVGTVCAYPKYTPVPFKEDDLWNGYPEETNAPYGIAKKSLLVMAQAYRQQYGMNIIYLLPVNLYGPGDNFDPRSSHVIPALVRKFVEAVEDGRDRVVLWGTGKASREFLYVTDAAEGIILATERYNKGLPVNLGTGEELTIDELARSISEITGFRGKLEWDATKPDGQPRRRLETTRAEHEFGFQAKTKLKDGLTKTIEWYKATLRNATHPHAS
ncbi:MAG: GDP-L-fucose synthase [Candidatus Bathyarchaeia archaeon]